MTNIHNYSDAMNLLPKFNTKPTLPEAQMAKVELALPVEKWLEDIESLPEKSLLAERGVIKLYLADLPQIPHIIHEIGRLRELTFRGAKEGSGNSLDLDHYDTYYKHLFLWNSEKQEVIGAYRLGLMDQIFASHGCEGLYTYSLFRLKRGFLKTIQNGLELGRSFIRKEYQRNPQCLSLLWKGILTFCAENPQYNRLFGAVTISGDYKAISKNLMIQYLKEHNYDRKMARQVRARTPFRVKRKWRTRRQLKKNQINSIEDVSVCISAHEEDDKGVPVLLRHYLKLNAKLLSFNIDHEFCDVVDGLIVVNVNQIGEKYLNKFMGREKKEKFLNYHAA